METISLKIRVEKIISEFGLNKSNFSRRCGFSEGQARLILSGSDVGFSKVVKIIDAFPELNPMWILKGEGRMWVSKNYENHHSKNSLNEQEFCSECYRKEGQIAQLEVFNQSLVKRNDELSQEIGRLKGVIEDIQRGAKQSQKDTG